jgi:hypothetical protein
MAIGTTAVTTTQACSSMAAVIRMPRERALPQVASRTPIPSSSVARIDVRWASVMTPATANIESTE